MAARPALLLHAPRGVAVQALSLLVIIGALAAGVALQTSDRADAVAPTDGDPHVVGPAELAAASVSPPPPAPPRLPRSELWNKGQARDVTTAWYEVPPDSIARRRAREEEFTAAHNELPIGTLVRVTHLKNGKQVLVRITDRGIHDRRVTLDVCKEAAEKLGIVDKGLARVRMQVLAETSGASAADSESTAP